jgi:hypothetical protein
VIHRVFVRGLSPHSYGNGHGIGMADMTTDRLVNAIDMQVTAVNMLTSGSLGAGHIPLHYPTDRECLDRLSLTVGKLDPMEVKFGWIRNSLEVTRLALSENLRREIAGNPLLQIEGETEFRFGGDGNLLSPFARVSAAE